MTASSSIEHPRPDLELPLVEPERYVLGREIASGGQGRIRAARDRRLGRTVAIKELISPEPQQEARFGREIRLTARLQHPGVPSLYDAARWPSGRPFYAMRMVRGDRLGTKLRRAGNEAERQAFLPPLFRVVETVAYAHRRGIVHRDLDLSNIVIGPFGDLAVLDWGLAKDLTGIDRISDADLLPDIEPDRSSSFASLSVAGQVLGTPAYMAPEQAGGEAVDERADVYALGAILYHVLSGQPPYRETNPLKLIFAILTGPPPTLAERRPSLPARLSALVDRAMAREPKRRFANAADLADSLAAYQTNRMLREHSESRWSRWLPGRF